MKKELDYFTIDGKPGWNQDWFTEWWMKKGGCGAVTACDLSVQLARAGVVGIYPFDEKSVSRDDYFAFSEIMKPYLRPRYGGIDRLETFIDGYNEYLKDRGVESVNLSAIDGSISPEAAWGEVVKLIDRGITIPTLLLEHQDHATFDDFEWHWFNIMGYDDEYNVEAVTFGEIHTLPFLAMWDTGYEKKGGLVRVSPD